jgi:hypothetical protein
MFTHFNHVHCTGNANTYNNHRVVKHELASANKEKSNMNDEHDAN